MYLHVSTCIYITYSNYQTTYTPVTTTAHHHHIHSKMSKRPITSYFTVAPSKRPKISLHSDLPPSTHPSYPFPIACLPPSLSFSSTKAPDKSPNEASEASEAINAETGTQNAAEAINDKSEIKEIAPTSVAHKQDLDILHYHPFLHALLAKELFLFLRKELPFYRVEYKINRAGVETNVKTPRYTSLFGVDASSYFHPLSGELLDAKSRHPVPADRYRCTPRPLPQCVEMLRQYVAKRTGSSYNFVLINYYADGNDSISYHSDDERFLGENPTIASLSLGSRRDFLMKHKTVPALAHTLPLPSGDLLLMRSTTQSKWLHSILKRSLSSSTAGDSAASWAGGGRINITFRNAFERGGTENYYCYNIGSGSVYRWDNVSGKMVLKA
ncbi:DNA repair family protein [Morchella snyderi]|nr:DNA repair family protein [Morchella snyderi]